MRIKINNLQNHNFKNDLLRNILIFLIMLLALTIGIRLALGNNVLGIDFFIFWMTGKAAFVQHLNPYSDSLVQQIQLNRFNRLALPGEDHLAFVYPLYMLLLVFPLSFLEFPLAQAIWLAFFALLLATVMYALFSSRQIWQVVSAQFYYPFVFCIIIGNFTLMISLIFLTFFWFHYSNKLKSPGWQSVIGILFAFAAGKPQFSYLLFIFCSLIILKYRYWRILAWFTGAMIIFLGSSFIINPSWVSQWLSQVGDFSNYQAITPPYQSIIDLFRNGHIHNYLYLSVFIAMITLLIFLLINWWRSTGATGNDAISGDLHHFEISPKEIFILGSIGLITYTFHPTWYSYEQIILYIPFFLWAATRPSLKPVYVKVFWWTGMAMSWISFYLTSKGIFPQALIVLPIIFFAIWLMFILTDMHSRFSKEKLYATP